VELAKSIIADVHNSVVSSRCSTTSSQACSDSGLDVWRQQQTHAFREADASPIKRVLGDLSLKASPLFGEQLDVFEWVVANDVAATASSILPRCVHSLRDSLSNDWEDRHKMRRHVDCPKLPNNMKRKLSDCFKLGMCVCNEVALLNATDSFMKVVKRILQAKSGPRKLADHAMLVFKLAGEGGRVFWYHLSYGNYKTWRLRFIS
jgi:hypothetical protein